MAILDIFGKKKGDGSPENEAAAETEATAPAEETREGGPAISMSGGGQPSGSSAQPRRLAGPQAEAMKKIETVARAMYEGKRDCYLILDPRTTLEELEEKKNIRPLITALSPQNRIPVLRFASSEMVAEQVARNFNCVAEDKPLVMKVPFPAVYKILNDVMLYGVFGFVVHEVGKEHAGSTIHMSSYVLGELEKKDIRPYMSQAMTIQSLHQLRAINGRFYVVAAPGTTVEQAKAGDFALGFGSRNGKAFCSIFASRPLAEEHVSRSGVKAVVVEMNGQQLVDKLAETRNRLDQEFAIIFTEPNGAHIQISTLFIMLCCEVLKLQRPKINTKPPVAPEIVTMDGADGDQPVSAPAEEEAPAEAEAAEEPAEAEVPAEPEGE